MDCWLDESIDGLELCTHSLYLLLEDHPRGLAAASPLAQEIKYEDTMLYHVARIAVLRVRKDYVRLT